MFKLKYNYKDDIKMIRDMIKGNKSEWVADIVFEILAMKDIKFFSFSTLYESLQEYYEIVNGSPPSTFDVLKSKMTNYRFFKFIIVILI